MDLLLRPDEAERLRRILADYLSDLRMEIADTERYEWREGLKQDELFIKEILNRLEKGGVAAA